MSPDSKRQRFWRAFQWRKKINVERRTSSIVDCDSLPQSHTLERLTQSGTSSNRLKIAAYKSWVREKVASGNGEKEIFRIFQKNWTLSRYRRYIFMSELLFCDTFSIQLYCVDCQLSHSSPRPFSWVLIVCHFLCCNITEWERVFLGYVGWAGFNGLLLLSHAINVFHFIFTNSQWRERVFRMKMKMTLEGGISPLFLLALSDNKQFSIFAISFTQSYTLCHRSTLAVCFFERIAKCQNRFSRCPETSREKFHFGHLPPAASLASISLLEISLSTDMDQS